MTPTFVGLLTILALGTFPSVSFWNRGGEDAGRYLSRPLAYIDSADSGKLLAQQYCQGCHLLPDPSLLDKKTWTAGVLPNMALRLGLSVPGSDSYEGQIGRASVG
ncbi:MAG: hypothetical protein KKG00_13705, partial [Bacteroidetes bacterium]|nr:hypothetical protein [Bacteroidota bacterium]